MTDLDHARAALAEYDTEIRAGGEPHYPQWAADLLKACKEAERFTERVTTQGLPAKTDIERESAGRD